MEWNLLLTRASFVFFFFLCLILSLFPFLCHGSTNWHLATLPISSCESHDHTTFYDHLHPCPVSLWLEPLFKFQGITLLACSAEDVSTLLAKLLTSHHALCSAVDVSLDLLALLRTSLLPLALQCCQLVSCGPCYYL